MASQQSSISDTLIGVTPQLDCLFGFTVLPSLQMYLLLQIPNIPELYREHLATAKDKNVASGDAWEYVVTTTGSVSCIGIILSQGCMTSMRRLRCNGRA